MMDNRRLDGQTNRMDPVQLQALQDRDFAALKLRVQRIQEKVEIMNGERGLPSRPLSAVTRQDLSGLGSLSLVSAHSVAAPTKAEFDAVVDDIATINTLLTAIAARLGL